MRRYVLAAILVLGCGDDGGGMGQGPPSAPSTGNDPAYQVTAKAWLMAGDGLTAKDDTYDVAVTAPAGTSAIDLWIDQGPPARLTTNPDGSFHASVPAPAVG